MAEKNKSAQKSREHKESKHSARGARKSPMSELWKVQNGKGMARKFGSLGGPPRKRGGAPKKRPKDVEL